MTVLTLERNEIDKVKYVMDYWKHNNIKNMIVYDNDSFDGTKEALSKYDFIDLRDGDIVGVDDHGYTRLKNNAWKNIDCDDWIWICDFDEVLWSPIGLDNCLKLLDEYNVVKPIIYSAISIDDIILDDNKLLHEAKNIRFYNEQSFGKTQLFKPKEIQDMNFSLGSHYSNPVSNDGYDVKLCDCYEHNIPLFLIHIYCLSTNYLYKKYKFRVETMCEENKRGGLGIHYFNYEKPNFKQDLIDKYNNSISFDEVMKFHRF